MKNAVDKRKTNTKRCERKEKGKYQSYCKICSNVNNTTYKVVTRSNIVFLYCVFFVRDLEDTFLIDFTIGLLFQKALKVKFFKLQPLLIFLFWMTCFTFCSCLSGDDGSTCIPITGNNVEILASQDSSINSKARGSNKVRHRARSKATTQRGKY